MRRRHLIAAAAVITVITAVVGAGCSSGEAPAPLTPSTTTAGPTTTVTVAKPDAGTELVGPTTTSAGAPTDAPPAVATLSWLGRRAPEPGLQIPIADGTRWQGRVPGEYAVIKDGGYHWFGPDGSMVGCVPTGRCVAVDGQGYTAVVPTAGQPRLVYRPNGTFLGRFDAVGRRVAGGPAAGLMSAAIAATGVDLAQLLDEATRPLPYAGGVTGDPHFLTRAGTRVTTQLTGQFYARYGDPDREIQVRIEPMQHRQDVSIVTAVALSAAGSRIEFTSDGRLTIDGRPSALESDFDQVSIPGGPEVGRWAPDPERVSQAAVVWPDGGSVVMSANPALGLTVVALLPDRAGVSGLFGTGIGPNDLRDRTGAPSDPATAVPSWQLGVGDGTLFDEQVLPTPGFPSEIAAPPGDAQAASDAACRAAGVLLVPDRAACVFDVSLTGDDGFAAGHALMVGPVGRQAIATEFAARWPALVLGSTDGAPDLPSSGLIDTPVAPADHQVYRLTLGREGQIGLQFNSGCQGTGGPPAEGESAVRIFDAIGRPVGSRGPFCGQQKSAQLPAGSYYLVADGPVSGSPAALRVQVSLP